MPWAAALAWIFGILIILMLIAGANLGEALGAFVNGAFGGRNMAYLLTTLGRSALIIGMALSVMVSFRAGLFNIGGEGQLVLGGLAAAVVGVYLPGPGPLVLLAGLAAGALAGAGWGLAAALMQVKLGVPLLIGSLLLNYPARYFASYLVGHPLRDVEAGLPETHLVPQEAWLPNFPGTRLDIGITIIAVLAVGVVIYALRSVHGYRARMNGLSPDFARASGLPVNRITLQTLALSGAIAGLVGAVAVFGIHHRFSDGMLVQPLYAWTGIVSVLLVGMVPWAVPFSGFLFAAIQTGASGMERTADVPDEIALIVQAAIILFIAGRLSGIGSAGAESRREGGHGG